MPPGDRKVVRMSGGPRQAFKNRAPADSPNAGRNPFRPAASPSRDRSSSPHQAPSQSPDRGSLFVRTAPMAKRPNKLSGSPHSSDNESEPPSSEGRRSPSPTQESAEFRTPARGRPGPGSGRSVRFGAGAGKSGPSQPPRVGLGKGAGKGPARVRRIARDSIQGITKASIRRMARRGGVKRISATIYEDIRRIIHERLTRLLQMSITVACLRANVVKNDLSVVDKTVTIMLPDVIYSLRSFGTPVYGFDDLKPKKRRS